MALKDILPLDALLGGENLVEQGALGGKKKKKVDREALASAFMRIPRMDVRAARDLLDIGIKELYELQGRSAETLMDDVKAKKPETPDYRLAYFRMAVYFSEEDEPEPEKLQPGYWAD